MSVPLDRLAFEDAYDVTEVLQPALFGQVVKAVSKANGSSHAVKIIDRRLARSQMSRKAVPVLESADVELRLLDAARARPHPNLIGLTGTHRSADPTSEKTYVVMPFANSSDLFALLSNGGFYNREAGEALPLELRSMAQVLRLGAQLLSGVSHLHRTLGYAHMDLSPENVLVHRDAAAGDDAPCRLIICDYGLALPIGTRWTERRRISGKMPYQSPEVFHGRTDVCAAAADVFSLGVILFIMIFGNPPFLSPSRSDKRFAYIQDGQLGLLLKLWNCEASPACVDLLTRMLCEDPSQRITVEEAQAHPFMADAVRALALEHAAAAAAAAAATAAAAQDSSSAAPCTVDKERTGTTSSGCSGAAEGAGNKMEVPAIATQENTKANENRKVAASASASSCCSPLKKQKRGTVTMTSPATGKCTTAAGLVEACRTQHLNAARQNFARQTFATLDTVAGSMLSMWGMCM